MMPVVWAWQKSYNSDTYYKMIMITKGFCDGLFSVGWEVPDTAYSLLGEGDA